MASLLWSTVLVMAYPMLAGLDIDIMLLHLVERSLANWESPDLEGYRWQCIEICAGVGNLTKELLKFGFKAMAFDCIYSESHNFLTTQGLRVLCDSIASLARKGLVWFAPPCSSWVTLCSSVSMRDESNQFMGCSRPFVQEGNSQMCVMSLLYFVAALMGHVCCLEQPLNSRLPCARPLATVFDFFRCHKVVTYLGAFSGPTMKPLQVMTTSKEFFRLARARPDWAFEETLVTKNGNQYTGCKSALEDSAAYTQRFGQAVAETYHCFLNR
eukprot:Skav212214  [mRNA]  locus=scaffold3345:98248:99057:- [translate_table: standard]